MTCLSRVSGYGWAARGVKRLPLGVPPANSCPILANLQRFGNSTFEHTKLGPPTSEMTPDQRFCCCGGADDASAVAEIPTLQAMPQRDPVSELQQETGLVRGTGWVVSSSFGMAHVTFTEDIGKLHEWI